MIRTKYPLDALVRLREETADTKTRELAEAVQNRETATQRRVRAHHARAQHEDAARVVRDDESAKLARGELTVADLARADAWEARVRAEADELRAHEARAVASEGQAYDEEAHVRAQLAQRLADLDVVEKDKERFVDRQRKAADARDEEGAEEAFRARRA